MSGRLFIYLIALLAPVAAADTDKQPLTLEAIYHPENKVDFVDNAPRLSWLEDGRHVTQQRRLPQGGGMEVVKIDAETGDESPLLDRKAIEEAFSKLPGFGRDQLRAAGRARTAAEGPERKALLFDLFDDLYHLEIGGDVVRLTEAPGREDEADYSPDGRMVSFVRNHDVYVVDVKDGRERKVTQGGSEEIYNGILDWVYQEEIYGRGNFRGYWWRPDSSALAFLRLNEAPVPSFTVIDHLETHLRHEDTRYPKAGDPNPTVKLAVVAVAGGDPAWLDLSRYETGEFLIVNVGWTPDGKSVVFQVQNREQTWLDLCLGNPSNGEVTTVLHETTPAWVNEMGPPRWLSDGSFLWFSERTGYKHLYHYSAKGELLGAVTSGKWETTSFYGVDQAGWVYFSATERSPIGSDVYRVKLDGSGLKRLSEAPGTHRANFNPQCTLFLDSWSDANTPTQLRLYRSDGSLVRVIFQDQEPTLSHYILSEPEFFQVPTRDGFLMEAMLIKPPDFDPSRKYPVMSYTYSGPHAPQVHNSWGGTTFLWHQYLAQQGYLIWVCDNRSASGKGSVSTWPIHHNLGELELRDLEDGLTWLKSKPFVDGQRIGIWGWSYGGYMTSYALTHSEMFKIGIAGAPVTDWTLYDSVYTERYMGTPQSNPEGYERSSPRRAAANLHGKLLILHGTTDDNVHMQNTIQFIKALQEADKPFQLMLFPQNRHGIRDPQQVWHMRQLMTRFILDNL